MTAYATPDDLQGWCTKNEPLPDEADQARLLERARLSVDSAAGGWDVDEDGLPTDPTVMIALRDASCAQVEFWLSVGEAADIETWPQTTQSYQSGDVQTAGPPLKLAWRAREILDLAGLFGAVAY